MEVDPAQVPLPEDDLPQQPHHPRDIKLPPFWSSRPRAWFTFVESRFRLRGIEDDQAKFVHVLSALPADMVAQVIDIVDTMPEADQYNHFKAQLLETHQLSDYEKFDMLAKMEPMGGRKPSQLLHAMLEFCPAGMERHLSFHYFYMQRLPTHTARRSGARGPSRARHQSRPPVVSARAFRQWHSGGGCGHRRPRPVCGHRRRGQGRLQRTRRQIPWTWQQQRDPASRRHRPRRLWRPGRRDDPL